MSRSVIGIDFGNHNSVVGLAKKGTIDITPNDYSNRKTPSVVGFTDKKRVVGEEADFIRAKNWKNTITNIKELIQFPNIEYTQKNSPIKLLPSTNKGQICPSIKVLNRGSETALSAESIAAVLLSQMRMYTQRHSNVIASDAVISIPATLPTFQRCAVAVAGRVAGLNVAALLSEGAAVALSYGIDKNFGDKQRHVLFIDIGHLNASCHLVEFDKRSLTVLNTALIAESSGKMYTNALEDIAIVSMTINHNIPGEKIKSDPKSMARLEKAAEKAKSVLTVNKEARIYIESFVNDIDLALTITRDEFEAAIKDKIDLIAKMASKVIEEQKIAKSDIHSLEIIGGSSRIPLVIKTLENFFERKISHTCNADEAVALGCTLRCAISSPLFRVREFKINDCYPYEIKVLWGSVTEDYESESYKGDYQSTLFRKFSIMPSSKLISFEKSEPFQVVLRYANPSELPIGSKAFLARLLINPPEEMNKPAEKDCAPPKIKVTILLDTNGCILVQNVQLFTEAMAKDESVSQSVKKDDKKVVEQSVKKDDKKVVEQNSSEKKEVSSEEKEIKMKKVIRKSDVKFEEDSIRQRVLNEDRIGEMSRAEIDMQKYDNLIVKLGELKNDLESFIIATKSRITNEWKNYLPENYGEQFLADLDQTENWLYAQEVEDPSSIGKLEAKLNDYLTKEDLISKRKKEAENFIPKMAQLASTASKYEDQLNQAKAAAERYDHLTEGELMEVKTVITSTKRWINEAEKTRRECPLYEDCEVEIMAIDHKMNKIRTICEKIFGKPRPKKEKSEEKITKKSESEKPKGKVQKKREKWPTVSMKPEDDI